MTKFDSGCLVSSVGRPKSASATIYLMDELSDARMRCDELVRAIAEANQLVERAPDKDRLYELAGHLIQSIPSTAFELQKALQAAALAANHMDSEKIEQDQPVKTQELENVLDDVRMRQVPMKNLQTTNKTAFVEGPNEEQAKQIEVLLEDIRAIAMASLVKVNSGSWRWVLSGLSYIIGKIGTVLLIVDAESDTAEKLRLQVKRIAQHMNSGTDLSEAKVAVIEETLTQIKMMAAKTITRVDTGSWKRALKGLAAMVQGIGTVITEVDEDPALAERVYRQVSVAALRMVSATDIGEMKKKFKEQNPEMTDEDLNKVVTNWFDQKDSFKDKEGAWKVNAAPAQVTTLEDVTAQRTKLAIVRLETAGVYGALDAIAQSVSEASRVKLANAKQAILEAMIEIDSGVLVASTKHACGSGCSCGGGDPWKASADKELEERIKRDEEVETGHYASSWKVTAKLPKSAEDLAKQLFDFANEMYSLRGASREHWQMLNDVSNDWGGFSGLGDVMDDARKAKDILNKWDQTTGDAASALELVARKAKKVK